MAVIGILFILFFLDSYPRNQTSANEKKSLKNQFELIKSTILHLKNRNQLLIIPITFWLGFEQAFIGADFTKVFFLFFKVDFGFIKKFLSVHKSFVTCTKGVKFVGMTMICFGVTDVIGLYILFQKYENSW